MYMYMDKNIPYLRSLKAHVCHAPVSGHLSFGLVVPLLRVR